MVTTTAEPCDPLVLPQSGESWRVLYTRSRHEKRLAHACRRFGVRHYLPLREGRIAWARGRSLLPLFPGYTFVCPEPEGYVDLLRTGLVVKTLPVPQPEVLIEELRAVRAALATGADLVSKASFGRGRRVRVVGGPLRDVVGVVTDRRVRRGRVHLVLNVTMLGQGAMVEIDAVDVDPIGGWRHREGLWQPRSCVLAEAEALPQIARAG